MSMPVDLKLYSTGINPGENIHYTPRKEENESSCMKEQALLARFKEAIRAS